REGRFTANPDRGTRSGTSPAIGVRGEAAFARGAEGEGEAGDRAGGSAEGARGLPDPARDRGAAGAGGGALAVSAGRSGGDAGAAAFAGGVRGALGRGRGLRRCGQPGVYSFQGLQTPRRLRRRGVCRAPFPERVLVPA